jgi:hypothetical protein
MSENRHVLTQLPAPEHFTEFFYELNKGLKQFLLLTSPLGKKKF